MWIMIQARTASTRFPNKAMAELSGEPLIKIVFDKCREVWPKVVVLIPYNDPLRDYLYKNNMPYIEGPAEDVLARYYKAACAVNAEYVMRITADCPMLDVAVMHYMASRVTQNKVDFMTNLPCPDGYDCEIMSFRALEWACNKAIKPEDREHVTTFIKSNMDIFSKGFRAGRYKAPYLLEWFPKLSCDTKEDLTRLEDICERIKKI